MKHLWQTDPNTFHQALKEQDEIRLALDVVNNDNNKDKTDLILFFRCLMEFIRIRLPQTLCAKERPCAAVAVGSKAWSLCWLFGCCCCCKTGRCPDVAVARGAAAHKGEGSWWARGRVHASCCAVLRVVGEVRGVSLTRWRGCRACVPRCRALAASSRCACARVLQLASSPLMDD